MKKLTLLITFALFACLGSNAQQRVLSLQDCKELSMHYDVNLINSDLDIASARLQKHEAFLSFFPSMSITGMGMYAIDPLLRIGITDLLGKSDAAWNVKYVVEQYASQYEVRSRYEDLQYAYGVGVMMTQPLFAGGRIVNGNKLAALGIDAAKLQHSIQVRKTDEEIEEKYWRVVSLQEKQKTLAVALETVDSLMKDAQSALKAGIIVQSDYTQVKLKKSELLGTQVELNGGIRLAKMDLFNTIGVNYASISSAADAYYPYIDDIIMADSLGDLPSPNSLYVPEEEMAYGVEESKLLDIQVKAKTLERNMAFGEGLPQIAVSGVYGFAKLIGEPHTNGALLAVIKIPISDVAKQTLKTRRLNNEVIKARNEQEYLDAQLILRARQAWVSLQTAWERLSLAEESYKYTQDEFHRQEANFKAGLVTMTDLLSSNATMRQAEDKWLDRCMDYRSAVNAYRNLSSAK